MEQICLLAYAQFDNHGAMESLGWGNAIVALVDCNNFYASCERVFNPKLEGQPVIVLSNNDGCVVSRSPEAKALGIKMGEPVFKLTV